MVTVLPERRKLHLKVLPEVDTHGSREKKADLHCSGASGEFRTSRHHITAEGRCGAQGHGDSSQ